MKQELIERYNRNLKSLFNFMAKNGYTKKPFPKVNIKEDVVDDTFGPTANYDPTNKEINLYVNNRLMKDVLRSAAHEMVHHKQNLEGRLGDDAYSGDKITEDDKLIKLEEEAYLDGNISFRKWTEMERKGKV